LIVQFFASKKKRAFSAKTAKDSSPGAKGSLENYLVTSQNDDSSTTQGPARRNLVLEIDLSTKHEKKETLFPNEARFRGSDSSGAVPTGVCGASNEGTEADANASLGPVHCHENLELKQFAVDFLSLYCR